MILSELREGCVCVCVSILHIVIVSGEQRGNKEVETVSLKSKCIFGQNKMNPLCFYCLSSSTCERMCTVLYCTYEIFQ